MKCWRTRLVILSRLIIIIALLSTSLVSGSVTTGQSAPASQAMERGKEAFKSGEFEKAAEHWTEADHLYLKAGDLNGQFQALLKIAKARQAQGNQAFIAGDFGSAVDHYMETAQLYEWVGDINRRSLALLQQAEALQAQGHYKEALDQIAISDNLANELFQKSKYAQAADSWTQIVRLSKQGPAPDLPFQLEKLLQLSESLQYQGRYLASIKVLDETLVVIAKIGGQIDDRKYTAITLSRLGNAHAALEEVQPALGYLIVGLSMVDLQNSSLKAALLNDRGNVLAVQAARLYQEAKKTTEQELDIDESESIKKQAEKYNEAAINDYVEAAREAAEPPANRGLEVTATLNYAKALVMSEEYKLAKDQTDYASQLVQQLPLSDQQANGLINVALLYQDLQKGLPESQESLFHSAEDSLNKAALIAEKVGSARAKSYAWGQLGNLYEKHGRVDDALKETRKAVSVLTTQMEKKSPSLYRWEWQLGRLLKEKGEIHKAFDAYKRAASALKDIPRATPRGFRGQKVTFRDGPGRLLIELSDLYLKNPSLTKDEKQSLTKARAIMEDFKTAEIQDYYQDDCVEAYGKSLTTIDSIPQAKTNAAVIYPIQFSDRLEILSTISGKIHRAPPTTISEETLEKTVYAFRKALQLEGLEANEIIDLAATGEEAYSDLLKHGNTLYNWLIRPWEAMLDQETTLVFVPDGVLRTIPIAALYDEQTKKFLIQKYPIATASGFKLPDPKSMDRKNLKVLYMGLTTGGKTEGRDFPPLPGVKKELETLQNEYGQDAKVTSFLDQDFKVENVTEEMKDEAYTVVHVATHAVFANDVNNSFILASEDKKIALNDLRQMIGVFKFRERPLDLLTLSACQTAVGDEQAALGLASIAINAGARSALATLWSVRDKPSSKLISLFYDNLKDPDVTKAGALQHAQKKMLESQYRHPFFWSGFLLLNNWL